MGLERPTLLNGHHLLVDILQRARQLSKDDAAV
jgi:hypothetical protein